MKRNSILFALFIFVIAVVLAGCAEKKHGEIFTKTVADQQYGDVLESIELPVSTLRSLLENTDTNIMFRITEGQLIVLDNNRNVIYPETASVEPDDVFSMFSVSVVNDLLSQAEGLNVSVESRNEVLSITYGDYTLEVASPCPPFCGDD